MNTEKLGELIEKFKDGKISEEEKQCLDEWYDSFDSTVEIYQPYSPELEVLGLKKFSELMTNLKIGDEAKL